MSVPIGQFEVIGVVKIRGEDENLWRVMSGEHGESVFIAPLERVPVAGSSVQLDWS